MKTFRLLAAALAALAPLSGQTGALKVDSNTISGLGIRTVGPAVMSGRISAMDAIIRNGRLTVYVGSASGGLWKSVNGGTTFKPVFDKYCQSIGAVTIDPSNPDVVWVGTGETWVRNSVSVGDGVYKSTDGGDTWTRMGLASSERVARILVDPSHPGTVYAAATGRLWGSGGERGVYRSTDGGETWTRILATNEDSGCSSLAMDPKDPKTLYAGLWQFRRKPWKFESGGTGSGLFKSTDGGSTWKPLGKGLPEGELGRIAVEVAPSDPKIVYALVEAKRSALFRSDDAGETWQEVNNSFNVTGRPFYFANLAIDPKNPMRVYKPGYSLGISEDGGRSFSPIAWSIHGDFHPVWINPENPEQLFVGDDGGIASSQDRGGSWLFHRNLPLAQFYHVSVDSEVPYNVYGGLQDNDSWMGPSRSLGAVQNRHWKRVGPGGDGFWVFSDPSDPTYVYAESQGGYLIRKSLRTGEQRDIQPQPGAGEPKLRFNWNTPIHLSPSEKGALYIGAQYLFRSRDHGESWERISPDLTTNDTAKQQQEESGGLSVDNSSAETHTTIYSICESPKNGSLIWVGTDDGNLQLTRDGGKTWTNVAKNVPGLPPCTWVSWIQASLFEEGTAYATFDGHAAGDMRTYVFRTRDYGRTWQSLARPELRGYAHVVKEDPVNRDLLYLGTELGLFISLDGGTSWALFKGANFPDQVAVRDIVVHPRDHDLVLATHGRGIWIIDDITPLRALTPRTLEQDTAFLPARPSALGVQGWEGWSDGDAEYDAPMPVGGALISYYLKKRHIFGELKLEVLDAQGKVVGTLPSGKRRGINRVPWEMRLKAPRMPAAASGGWGAMRGPRLPDGAYTVRMTKDGKVTTAPLVVIPDPRLPHSREDRAVKFETMVRLRGLLEHMTFVAESITGVREQYLERLEKLPAGASRQAAEAFAKEMESLRGRLLSTKESDGGITGEERIREKMDMLYASVDGYEGRPTRSQMDREKALGTELDSVEQAFRALLRDRLDELNRALAGAKLEPITVLDRATWERKGEPGSVPPGGVSFLRVR